MTYLVCFLLALLGIGIVFTGRKNEPAVIAGAALYFFALFVAAIAALHSMQ